MDESPDIQKEILWYRDAGCQNLEKSLVHEDAFDHAYSIGEIDAALTEILDALRCVRNAEKLFGLAKMGVDPRAEVRARRHRIVDRLMSVLKSYDP